MVSLVLAGVGEGDGVGVGLESSSCRERVLVVLAGERGGREVVLEVRSDGSVVEDEGLAVGCLVGLSLGGLEQEPRRAT